jgi:hypothetical protein
MLGVGGAVATSRAPEPSTWAMMVLGFVGLGYAAFRNVRSRRRSDLMIADFKG